MAIPAFGWFQWIGDNLPRTGYGTGGSTHGKWLRHLVPFLRGGIPFINGSSINPANNHLVSHLAIMNQNHESAKQFR